MWLTGVLLACCPVHSVLSLQLARHLPNSVVGCSWKLAYSTNVHGISLRTMYRNMREMDGPILMAVRDESQHVSILFV